MLVRSYQNELWKEINLDDRFKKEERFFISNFCRIVKEVNEEKTLLPERYVNGYQVIYAKLLNEKSKRRAVYVHKIMAETFLEKKENQQFVLHLNYDKKDNALANLAWATKREKEIHQFKNPHYKEREKVIPTSKLTETRVRLIKRKIFDPNRRTRMKMIAKQFGISTMQLYRIKTGENWGHVTDF